MTKTIGALSLAAALLGSGIALAHDPAGHGPGWTGGNAAAARQFQKETQALREDLAAKQIDLGEEYDKDAPDQARIAALKKDIGQIEAKLQAASDKYGVGRRAWSRGMMSGAGGQCGCGHCW